MGQVDKDGGVKQEVWLKNTPIWTENARSWSRPACRIVEIFWCNNI